MAKEILHVCPECKETFEAKSNQKFCSADCRCKYNNRRYRYRNDKELICDCNTVINKLKKC